MTAASILTVELWGSTVRQGMSVGAIIHLTFDPADGWTWEDGSDGLWLIQRSADHPHDTIKRIFYPWTSVRAFEVIYQ